MQLMDELSEIDLMDVDEVISNRISSENVLNVDENHPPANAAPVEKDNTTDKIIVVGDDEVPAAAAAAAVNEEADEEDEAVLPIDPRSWSADDIKCWLKWVVRKFNVNPATPDYVSRFPLTGDELVQFSRAEFWVCAGKTCGDTLMKHLAIMMQSITGQMAPADETYEQDPRM